MPRHGADIHPAKRFLTDDYRHYYRPSPPPIATISQSPSLSSDTSSISSPPTSTVLPSLIHTTSHHDVSPSANYMTTSTTGATGNGRGGAYSPPSSHYSPYYPAETVSPPDVFHTHHAHSGAHHSPHSHYAQPPSYGHPYSGLSMRPGSGGNGANAPSPMQTYSSAGYHHGHGVHPSHHHASHHVGHHVGHHGHGHHGHGHGGYEPIYTSDAATKLNDRVRRRCYNCRSTDTSTWRRSSLHLGKVLCNKCGLFERTHSKNRPPQFPNKRASSAHLTSPTFGDRSPPSSTLPPPSLPPPIQQTQTSHHMRDSVGSAGTGIGLGLTGTGNGNGAMGGGMQGQQNSTVNVPPHPAHPSLDPAYTHSNTLPQIQEWLRGTNSNGTAQTGTNIGSTGAATSGSPNNGLKKLDGSRADSVSLGTPASVTNDINNTANNNNRQSLNGTLSGMTVLTPSPSPTRSPSPVGHHGIGGR